MGKAFSRQWNRSKNPNKQRKFMYNAPLHLKGKFLHVHLSRDLRAKHMQRQARVKKGDKVKIMRGQFKGRDAAVNRVDLMRTRLYLEGIEVQKKSGAKAFYPVHPSNVQIISLVDVKSRFKHVVQNKNQTGVKPQEKTIEEKIQ